MQVISNLCIINQIRGGKHEENNILHSGYILIAVMLTACSPSAKTDKDEGNQGTETGSAAEGNELIRRIGTTFTIIMCDTDVYTGYEDWYEEMEFINPCTYDGLTINAGSKVTTEDKMRYTCTLSVSDNGKPYDFYADVTFDMYTEPSGPEAFQNLLTINEVSIDGRPIDVTTIDTSWLLEAYKIGQEMQK